MATTRRSPLRLRVSRPGSARTQPPQPLARWWVVGLVGGLVAAVAGWIVIAGVVVLGWISATAGPLVDAIRVGTQAWLLAHGAGAEIGPLRITLTPLLLTGLLWLLVHWVASFTGKQVVLAAGPDGVNPLRRAAQAGRVAGVVAGSYAATVGLTAIVLAPPDQAVRALVAAVLLAGTAALVGASGALGLRPWRSWPAWARSLPRAVGLAVGVCLLGGTAVTVVGLLVHLDRVRAVSGSLHAPVLGTIVLTVAQALWLPTMLLWGTSFVLGGGFRLGSDTVVSLVNTHVGLLPGVPVLAAVPANGQGGWGMLWWLGVGLVAGAAAGWFVVRSRPAAASDEPALVGGLAGVVAALCVTALCALSRGGLGAERMADMGPRLPELLVMSCSLMGLSGLAAGLAFSLLRRRRGPGTDVDDDTDVETQVLPRLKVTDETVPLP